MDRRAFIQGLGALTVARASPALAFDFDLPAQARRPWDRFPSITVLAAEQDARVESVKQAIRAWNTELFRMNSGFRLGAARHMVEIVQPDVLRAIHTAGASDLQERRRAEVPQARFHRTPATSLSS